MLLCVLHTVISIGATSAVGSAGSSTATSFADTGLQEEGDGTPGLSVQTVVAACCRGARVTVVTGPEAASWPTVAAKRTPPGPTNHAVVG